MKSLYKSLIAAVLVAAPVLVACEDDNDDNPTLKFPESFVLNEPVNAVNVYDLENSQYVVLTTAQPDYGYTAPVTYTAYASLDGTKYEMLGTTSTSTEVRISAKELNDVVLSLAGDADLSAPVALSMKLSAVIDAMPETQCWSNVITLPQVQAYVPVVEVALPTDVFIVGGFPASGWGTFIPMHEAYSQPGVFYNVVYLEQGKSFRFSTKANWSATFGYSVITREGDVAEALEDAQSDDNYSITCPTGLYCIVLKAKIANGSVAYTMTINPAKIYLFGATGGDLWEWSDANLFTDNGDGTATSPAMTAAGELRLAVDCGIDWWKTEFTIMNTDATLFFRNCDIPSNWASDLGADYSFQGAAGKQIVLDFTTEPATGAMK